MPSLKDHIKTINAAEISKRAEVEAALLAQRNTALVARDEAAKTVESHQAKLTKTEARPLEDLPDTDEAVRERLLAVEVVKGRIAIAQKKLAVAETTVAEAEAAIESDKKTEGIVFQKAAEARERFIAEFDRDLRRGSEEMFDLIRRASALEQEAARVSKKPSSIARAGKAVATFLGLDDAYSLHFQLVDRGGAVIWRGDQNTSSATDTAAAR
jgi:hypothetical protein